ncbi:MAG: helix-turn-helix domain-containing protein [Lutibacter sp.]|uniref:AraC family transcriptional regulator n=1 Tax=Lutibacter sp. TaxID=1925666 RepID=UPI00299E226A|nr:helix-turn-helix domain-containing protein [Lutibacter sp.]MDX1828687.1 helix-turn-helix domain-containing protein [Lutibacter sp.]
METSNLKEIHIKGMVCDRCISVVKTELENLGAQIIELKLGKAIIKYPKHKITLQSIENALVKHNFELIIDEDTKTIEAIKTILVEIISKLPIEMTTNLSVILANKLEKDYTYLSKLFSNKLEITIEKYFILLKIEKTKELIQAGQLNFTQISYDLGYSSVNYLSNQFKQITGMSMSTYKKLSIWNRKSLDKIV